MVEAQAEDHPQELAELGTQVFWADRTGFAVKPSTAWMAILAELGTQVLMMRPGPS